MLIGLSVAPILANMSMALMNNVDDRGYILSDGLIIYLLLISFIGRSSIIGVSICPNVLLQVAYFSSELTV